MFNNIFKFSGFLVLAFAFIMTACQKENLTDLTTENFTQPENGTFENGGPKGKGGKCYHLVFPVTVAYPDGTTAVAPSKDSLRSLIHAWKKANPTATTRPSIAFPYTVELSDGTTQTVANATELQVIVDACRTEEPKGHFGFGNKCFKLVYPVTINFPDGTTSPAADKAALKTALVAWKAANPDSTTRPSLAMPYSVTLKADSSVVVISTEADLITLRATCEASRPNKGKCFTIVYPVTLVLPDGSTVLVNDEIEARTAFITWKKANPSVHGKSEIALPFTVTLEDGTTKTIATEADKTALRASCGEVKGGKGGHGNGGKKGGKGKKG